MNVILDRKRGLGTILVTVMLLLELLRNTKALLSSASVNSHGRDPAEDGLGCFYSGGVAR